MLFAHHGDDTCGLTVEGAGDVLDGVGYELLDAVIGDGGFVGDLVEGAAGFDEFEEGRGVGGHFGGCAGGEVLVVGGQLVGEWLLIYFGRSEDGGGQESFVAREDPLSRLEERA